MPVGDGRPRVPRRNLLIWLFETEGICAAVCELAPKYGGATLAAETTSALRAAHREAEAARHGRIAFRFLPPVGAEHLMVAAATKARCDARRLRGREARHGDSSSG